MSSMKKVGRWHVLNPTPEQEKAMSRLDEYVQGPWEHHPLTYGDVVWQEGNACIIVCQVLPGVQPQHAMGGVQRSLTHFLSAVPEMYAVCMKVRELVTQAYENDMDCGDFAFQFGELLGMVSKMESKAYGKKEK